MGKLYIAGQLPYSINKKQILCPILARKERLMLLIIAFSLGTATICVIVCYVLYDLLIAMEWFSFREKFFEDSASAHCAENSTEDAFKFQSPHKSWVERNFFIVFSLIFVMAFVTSVILFSQIL